MSTSIDPRLFRLPQWAKQHISRLEGELRTIKERATPGPNRAELQLSGSRLHIRNLNPDEIDVNYAGLFLVVYPQANNHIILRAGEYLARIQERKL